MTIDYCKSTSVSRGSSLEQPESRETRDRPDNFDNPPFPPIYQLPSFTFFLARHFSVDIHQLTCLASYTVVQP